MTGVGSEKCGYFEKRKMVCLFFPLVFVLLCQCQIALAIEKSKIAHGQTTRLNLEVNQDVLWYRQRLDHFNPLNKETFLQRYFVNLDYWSAPDGPIFLLICGEYVCPGITSDYRLVLGREFNAALVALEHRYYGKSQPLGELTPSNMRFLSSKQAIFDLATFRNYFQAELNAKFNRTNPPENAWIAIGVSYPGALSAWFHLKFPHLTKGALASSAVVKAVFDFPEFDEQVAVSAGEFCAQALKAVTKSIELELEEDSSSIKSRFHADVLTDDGDFLYFIADAAVFPFQYGHPDTLCGPLLEAKAKGITYLDVYVDYVTGVFASNFGGDPGDYDRNNLRNSSIDSPHAVSRAWWYQCCTELAYFQTAPSEGIRSKKLNLEYFLGLCNDLFGLPLVAETDMTNLYYGAENISSSNIFFVNGSQDPWRHASKKKSSTGEPSRIVTCHNCGHGSELRGCPQWPSSPLGDSSNCSDPKAVESVRKELTITFQKWLSQEVSIV